MSGMGKGAARELVGLLARLFPRWKTTPELVALWADRLSAHDDPEVVRIVLNEHRAQRRGDDPSLSEVLGSLRKTRGHMTEAESAAYQARAREAEDRAHAESVRRDYGEARAWFAGIDEDELPAVIEEACDGVPPMFRAGLRRILDQSRTPSGGECMRLRVCWEYARRHGPFRSAAGPLAGAIGGAL